MYRILAACLGLALTSVTSFAEERPRVLLLSKSSGFQHSAIARQDGPSHVERVLSGIALEHGFDFEGTKDASLISKASLAAYDAVVFYTTGDLTQAGTGEGLFGGDGEPPMSATGIEELRAWVGAGGAFLAFHSASDTFHMEDDSASPYIQLLGGEFVGHGRQFEGRLKVVDPTHAAMRAFPQGWGIMDEWYTFKNLDTEGMHVLALLETASDELSQQIYDRSDYPVIWCKSVGEGRVFYNAMGHREEVWDEEIFQQAFVDALHWALGRSDLDAAPNYSAVVSD